MAVPLEPIIAAMQAEGGYTDEQYEAVINEIETNGEEVVVEEEVVTEVKGCMDSTATNYNEKATVDDGSCEYPAELMHVETLPEINISESQFINREDPRVIKAQKDYNDNISLLDLDEIPGIDDKYRDNIKNTDVVFGKDRKGNDDSDVKSTTTIGGIVKTLDNDGDESYHYTEDHEKYSTSWWGFGVNKADDEDIEEFDAQYYEYELNKVQLELLNKYKGDTSEGKALLDETTKAAAIKQLQIKDINLSSAKSEVDEVNKRIQSTNKELDYEVNVETIDDIAARITELELNPKLNKKQKKELELLNTHKDDLYVVDKLNTRIEELSSDEYVTRISTEIGEVTDVAVNKNQYDSTDQVQAEKDLIEDFNEKNNNAIVAANDYILKISKDKNSKVNKKAENIFLPRLEKIATEMSQERYDMWNDNNSESIQAIQDEKNDFYDFTKNPENVLALLEDDNRIELETLNNREQEILNTEYSSNKEVKKANKELEKLRKEREKIFASLSTIVQNKYAEEVNKEIGNLWQNSEDFQKLEIDLANEQGVIEEEWTEYLNVEYKKIHQGIIDKTLKTLEWGGPKVSEKEFSQFDAILDEINYNRTTDTEKKRELLDKAWSIISKDYIERGVKNVGEKRKAFMFKYYADIMYTADGSMSSAAVKDQVISIVTQAPKEIYELEKKLAAFNLENPEFERLIISKGLGMGHEFAKKSLTTEERELLKEYNGLTDQLKQWNRIKSKGQDIIDRPSYYEVENSNAFINLWRGFSSGKLVELAPFLSGVYDIQKNLNVLELYKKEARGEELNPAEKNMLLLNNVEAEQGARFSEISKAYRTGEGLKDMIPFVFEMVLTSGIYTGAKAAAQKTIQLAIKKSIGGSIYKMSVRKGIKAKIKNGAVQSLSTIFGTLVQSAAATTQNTIASTIEDMTPVQQMMFTTDGDDIMYQAHFVTVESVEADIKETQGQLDDPKTTAEEKAELNKRLEFLEEKKKGIKYDDADFDLAFRKRFLTGWAEYFSERLGGAIPNFGVKRAFIRMLEKNGPEWLKRTMVSRYLKNKGVKTFQEAIEAIANFTDEKMAWDGLMGEVFEEVVNQPMQNLIMGDDWDEGFSPQFFGDITRVSAVAQIAFGGVSMGINIGKKKQGYNFNGRDFETYKAMMRSVQNYSKKSWKKDKDDGKEFPKINVSNDNNAFIATYDFLEGNNIDTKGLINEDVEARRKDINAAYESKIIALLHDDNKQEQVAELDQIEKDKNEIDEQINQTKDPEALDKLNRKKAALDQKKEVIIAPYVERVSTELFEADVAKVREGLTSIDEVTGVETTMEVTDDAGVKQFVRQDMLQDMGIVAGVGGELIYLKSGQKVGIQALKSINEQVDNALDKSNHGFIGKPKDGKRAIIINRDNAIKGGAYNVASHEFLHAVLFKTLNDNPATQLAVGQALGSYLQDLDFSTIKDTAFLKRVMNYQKTQGEGIASEEIITLFSDALKTGDIQYNETTGNKIGDVFRRVMSRAGVELTFGKGSDIFNFVKDFNYNVEKGNWTEIAKAAKGIKLEGEVKEYADLYTSFQESLSPEQKEQYSLSKDPNEFENFAQKIYDDPSLDLATKAFFYITTI